MTVSVIKCGRLIDGTGREAIEDAVVLLDGTQITEAGPAAAIEQPADAKVIDLSSHTVLPGLIDTHLHLTQYNVLTFTNYRVALFETSPELQLLYAQLHAQMCMESGFTTLRDLGGINYVGQVTAQLIALRDAIAKRIIAGPRIKATGWAVITSAHLDLGLPRNAPRGPGINADGPWELRKLAREQLRLGCDVIKTSASGGGGTDKEEPTVKNMTLEELTAVADEAHAFGKLASCHCFTAESQIRAVKAGIDTIEHCVFTDDEAIRLIKAEDKIVVPTLVHRTDHAIDIRRRTGASEFVTKKMKRLQPHTKETFQRLHAEGVTIAMGTDTQVDPEMGSQVAELEIYVDYGMTPMEAIQTATKNAAKAIGMERQLGTIEAGKLADIIAVDGNPLDDIRVLNDRNNIAMVMKDGYVFVDRREGHEKTLIHDPTWSWDLVN